MGCGWPPSRSYRGRLRAFGLAGVCAAFVLMAVPSAALALIPVNTVPPSIGGTAQQGQNLVCSPGTWLNSPTSYAYQWNRAGTAILGATASTYTVQAADVGQPITCSVTASNADGASLVAATSLPVVPIAPVDTAKPVNLTPPVITGTAQQGKVLNCSDGTWLNAPTSFARQWKRDGSAIAGATAAAYTVQAADVAHQLTCSVVATNGAGDSAETTSLPVVPIAGLPVAVNKPALQGSGRVSEGLVCWNGTWQPPGDSYSYRWTRDGTPIAGAETAGYAVVSADQGRVLACQVTAHSVAGDSTASSDPLTATAAAAGGGGGGGGQPSGGDRTPPVITGLSLLRRRFTVGRGATAIVSAAARRTAAGTAFRFSLSKSAGVAIVLARIADGYRQGKRCAPLTPQLRRRLARGVRGRTGKVRAVRLNALLRRNRCDIKSTAGSLARSARAGANTIPFTGRLGRRALPPGRYTAGLVAGDAAGNLSTWRLVSFEVVSAKRPAPRRRAARRAPKRHLATAATAPSPKAAATDVALGETAAP
jgi:hypothetical protein